MFRFGAVVVAASVPPASAARPGRGCSSAASAVAGCTADRWLAWNEDGSAIPAGTDADVVVFNP